MNTIKTAILMALLTVLLVMVGGALGGRNGAQMMLIISLIMNFITYWNSDTIILKSYNAREITRSQAPQLYGLVEQLARKAELPMPKVCIIRSEAPNAFATGRNPEHSAVCVTTGIMKTLSYEEMAGVLAHELSHIKHHDTLIATIAASFAGVISMIGNIAQWTAIFGGFGGRNRDDNGGIVGLIFMIVIAPLCAMLIQLAISRSREYDADKLGGEICGNPRDLARALQKIEYCAKNLSPLPGAKPATAHLFIINPLSGTKQTFASLFRTHPTTGERVARLEAQAREMGK